MTLNIRKLKKTTNCAQYSSFSCRYTDGYQIRSHLKGEVEDLCSFLSQRARYSLVNGLGVTYIAYENGVIVGFFTITTAHIRFNDDNRNATSIDKELLSKPYKTFPAVRIVQLAVQCEYQGGGESGTGARLLKAIEAISFHLSKNIGIRFLIVDALADSRTLKFYRRYGFHPHYDKRHDVIFQEIIDNRYDGKPLSSISMYLDTMKTKRGTD